MADPGTIIGVVSLGIQVAQGLIEYHNSFRGYDKEIESLISSTELLKTNLKGAQDIIGLLSFKEDEETTRIRDQLRNNICASESPIRDLETKCKKLRQEGSGTRAAFRNISRRATYHFQKQSILSLKTKVSEILEILNVGVNISQLDLIGGTRTLVKEVKNQQDLEKIKAWLAAPDYSAKHKLARERRQEGTAQWIFHESHFQHWLANGGILWLTGNAGSGKTILSSAIIERAKDEIITDTNCTVAYFHFTFNDTLHSSAEMTTRSLISQLSFTSKGCHPALEKLYQDTQTRKDVPIVKQLINTLCEIIRSLEKVFLIFDALDEAPQESELWTLLENLSTSRSSGLHICLLSRPSVKMSPKLEKLATNRLEMNRREIDKDIQTLVRAKLNNDLQFSYFAESHSKIETVLTTKADGMFLLADSQLGELRKCRTTRKINQALEDLPTTLNEQWQRCFDKARQSDLDLTIRLLTWLCFSQRPMNANELIDATAMPDEWCEDSDIELDRIKDPKMLLEIGADLVQMDQCVTDASDDYEGATFRLVHSSVKDWLQANATTERNFQGKSPFSEVAAHSKLAQDCMQYLTQFGKDKKWYEQDLSQWPLAYYAAYHWRDHLSMSDYSQESVDRACKILMNNQIRHNWRGIFVKFEDEIETTGKDNVDESKSNERHHRMPLAHAAYSGLDPVVKELLYAYGQDVNESASCASALVLAVEQNHLSTTRILVESGAKVNVETTDGISILGTACQDGSPELVAYLLDKGASDELVDLKSKYSSLILAAIREDNEVTRMLLEHGFDIESRSGKYQVTALHVAAEYLKMTNIQTLLEYGADRTLVDGTGELPLHIAAQQRDCSPEIVKLLYFEGAEMVKDSEGDIPLFSATHGNELVCKTLIEAVAESAFQDPNLTCAFVRAAGNGFLEVVKFLRKKGAQFSLENRVGLTRAAYNGHLHVVDYLVKEGATVDVRDSDGDTPFLCAVMNGHENICRFLAQSGANIHTTNNKLENSCYLAAQANEVDLLKWLLENGVDTEKHTRRGRSPIHEAAASGNLRALQCLIDNGADPDAIGIEGSKASHFAAANDCLETLRWLSDQGADMISSDADGCTPFHNALREGCLQAVTYLARCTPNYKAQRVIDGRTPLTLAAETGHINVAKWLIENGADVNERFDLKGDADNREVFALWAAILSEQFEMTMFLLQNGADPNIRVEKGNSLILVAASWYPVAYTKLLVQHGADFHDVRDTDGDDVVLLAIQDLNIEVLKWFIEQKVGLDTENKYGDNPLLLASALGQVKIVEILHNAGAECCSPDKISDEDVHEDDIYKTNLWSSTRDLGKYYEGLNLRGRYTPLMAAAFRGHLEVTKYLFTHFSEFNCCVDRDGNDALTYACCGGYVNIAEYLISNGLDKSRLNRAGRTTEQETEAFVRRLKQHAENEDDDDEAKKTFFEERFEGINEVLLLLRRKATETDASHADENDGDLALGAGDNGDDEEDFKSGKSAGPHEGIHIESSEKRDANDSLGKSTQHQGDSDDDDDDDDVFHPAVSRQGTEVYEDLPLR